MNVGLKEIILKNIQRMVEVEYDNSYSDNISHINAKLFKFYGKKGNELVSAILDFFSKSKNNEDHTNTLLTDLITYQIQYPNMYDVNIIVDYILKDKIDIKQITLRKIFNLIKLSSNKNLLFKTVENIPRVFTMSDVFTEILKLTTSDKSLGSDLDVINLTISLFTKLTKKDINYVVDMIYYMGKIYDKLPKPIKDKLAQYIDSLSFADQSKISFEVNNVPRELFTKLNTKDNYTIIGRPDIKTGLVLIKSQNGLYGYIDFNSHKIMISPMFDEISSVNKKHHIVGKVLEKRSEMNPGYYKMDSEGRIIEFNPLPS